MPSEPYFSEKIFGIPDPYIQERFTRVVLVSGNDY